MILKDLHLRFIKNKQNTGSGTTEFDTRFERYTLKSTSAANGYASCITLPKLPFGTTVQFTAEVRVISGGGVKSELHWHSSPYYGTVFTVGDRSVSTSEEWETINISYNYSAPANRDFARLNLEISGVGEVEYRNMELRVIGTSPVIEAGLDKKILERSFGPQFRKSQGITSTLSGDGAIDDSTSLNYTSFTSTSGSAFIKIDDFAGFEKNRNTEYYIMEVDALVGIQSGECITRFAFRDAVDGDVFVDCKMVQLRENGSATGKYETYKFFIPQDGSPSTIDEVEIEVGSLSDSQSTLLIREVRIRAYGLTTLNLKQKEMHSCCSVEKLGGNFSFDEDYRRENFNALSETDSNILKVDFAYITGKAPVPTFSVFGSTVIIPYVTSVSTTSISVGFRNNAGTILALSSIPNNYKFFLQAQS